MPRYGCLFHTGCHVPRGSLYAKHWQCCWLNRRRSLADARLRGWESCAKTPVCLRLQRGIANLEPGSYGDSESFGQHRFHPIFRRPTSSGHLRQTLVALHSCWCHILRSRQHSVRVPIHLPGLSETFLHWIAQFRLASGSALPKRNEWEN